MHVVRFSSPVHPHHLLHHLCQIDLLVIVATNDEMVPTHYIVTVGKDIDGPGAWGPRSRALASEKGWTHGEAEAPKLQRGSVLPKLEPRCPASQPKA